MDVNNLPPNMKMLTPENLIMLCKVTMLGMYCYDNNHKVKGEIAFPKLVTGLLGCTNEDAELWQTLPQEFHIQMKKMGEEIVALSNMLDQSDIVELVNKFTNGSDS